MNSLVSGENEQARVQFDLGLTIIDRAKHPIDGKRL